MHVMIDEPDEDMDTQIATHIVKVHQRRERACAIHHGSGAAVHQICTQHQTPDE